MLELQNYKNINSILLKNRNYTTLIGDDEILLQNICEGISNYYNKKGDKQKEEKLNLCNFFSKVKEPVSSKNCIYITEENLDGEFALGAKSELTSKLTKLFKEKIPIEPTLITINSLIEDLKLEESTIQISENISKYSNHKLKFSFEKLTASDFIKKIQIEFEEEDITLKEVERLKLYLGVMDKTQYFKYNDFPENLEEKQKFLNKVGEKINFVFYQGSFEKNSNIYWIISLDRETFFSEIYFELDNWYLTNGNFNINLGKKTPFSDIIPEKMIKFKISYFNGDFIYSFPKINRVEIFSYELFKLIVIAGILYFLCYLLKLFIIEPVRSLATKIGYSGKNIKQEVKFIEQKIEEITLENKNLEYTISDMKVYQNRKKIKDFLLGLNNLESIQDIISNIPVLNLKNYRVLILEILDVEVTDNIYDKIKISKEFVSKYFEEEVIYEIVDIDYKSIAIILEDKLSEEELEEVMICLANHCERNFKLTFSIAITKEYAKLNEMPRAYKEAKKILDYKFVFKQKRVIFLKDLDETQTKKYYYPIEIEAKLITKTLNANEIGIKRILDEIFDESNTADIDKKHLKEFSGLLYNSLGRILIQLKEMNSDIDPKIFSSEEILRANDLKELREKFEEKILDVCKIAKEKDEDDNSDIKNKIEKYLEDNYHIDISLDNLADYLGHSFKYTSILFKKVMGDNFKNYLNIYRIEKAKEIMAENKDIKIKDLAERIGYNSSNTFIRIFRKYEGVSPGKYFGLNE